MLDNRRSGYLKTELNLEDDFHKVIAEMIAIYEAKNKDYVGELRHKDILAGFRSAESFGMTVFQSCLIRMHDKYNRLITLHGNKDKPAVKETLRDTLIDLANYAVFSIIAFDELHNVGRFGLIKWGIDIKNKYDSLQDGVDNLGLLFGKIKQGFCDSDEGELKKFRFILFKLLLCSVECLLLHAEENNLKIESKIKKLKTKPTFEKRLTDNELTEVIKNI